ncbi:hypothetical protein JTB14_036119 [Gonioctena quinquepunctata]|nr:hypothetical protein JTB14_036119 [Gonioctena quinquepunctata]
MNVLQKHLKNEKWENCLVCLLKPCFESAHWLIPYEGYCVHSSKNYLGKPHFEKTKCGWWMYGLVAMIISQLIWNFHCLFDICAKDITSCLLLITREIIGLSTVNLYTMSLFKSSYYMAATNMWSEISEEMSRKSRVELFSARFRKYFYIRHSIGKIVLYTSYAIIICLFYSAVRTYGINMGTIAELTKSVSQMILVTWSYLFIQDSSLNIHILEGVYSSIQNDLDDAAQLKLLIGSLEMKLKCHINTIRKIKTIFRNVDEYYSPGFILFSILSQVILVINIYIFITPWKETHLLEIRSLQIGTLYIIIILIIFMNVLDQQKLVSPHRYSKKLSVHLFIKYSFTTVLT